jgi:hypothetical protein
MSLNVAGKSLSKSTVVAGAGLIIALVAAFLPWRAASIPWGLSCSAYKQCVAETGAFNANHSALVGWQGWVFLIAALLGAALLALRTFAPQVTVSPMPATDAPVYAVIAAVLLLMTVLRLLVGVGLGEAYYETAAGGVYTLGPGFGIFVGMVGAAVVGVGSFLMRGIAHPASGSTAPRPLPMTPAAPAS